MKLLCENIRQLSTTQPNPRPCVAIIALSQLYPTMLFLLGIEQRLRKYNTHTI